MSDVSRETEQLAAFGSLVRKWTPKINLISSDTILDLESRHIADSRQVAAAPDFAATWVDLGSGGGFPGIVVSILRPDIRVTLVESDRRKATFLSHVVRHLDLNAEVLAERVESLTPQGADIVSARALTSLDGLLAHMLRHGHSDATGLFPKGVRYREEIAAAQAQWRFTETAIPSKTNEGSVILQVRDVRRA